MAGGPADRRLLLFVILPPGRVLVAGRQVPGFCGICFLFISGRSFCGTAGWLEILLFVGGITCPRSSCSCFRGWAFLASAAA
jgi:hypothetical protein